MYDSPVSVQKPHRAMRIGVSKWYVKSWRGEARQVVQAISTTRGTRDYLVGNRLAAISVLSINRGD